MTVYPDANVLVSLFSADAHAASAVEALSKTTASIVVSDFARLEFSSVMARLLRTGQTDRVAASFALTSFDEWCAARAVSVRTISDDLDRAQSYIRRLDLNLRAPDAIHIAVAERLGATLLTFDRRMAECARVLGIETDGA